MADLIQIEDPNDPGTQRPMLRPLEVTAMEEEGETLLVLADPLHLLENPVVLPATYLPFLELLDGVQTLDQLAERMVKESGDLRAGQFLRTLVRKLDDHLLLDSPRFRDAWHAHIREYQALAERPAALAGISYPGVPEELDAFLKELGEEAKKLSPNGLALAESGVPDALVVPHIDLRRGGAAIARGYLEWEHAAGRLVLPGSAERPRELVVAFGTGHSVLGSLAVPTRKDFATPLGPVRCAKDVVDGLGRRLGEEIFTEEIAHREEHSLEFQAVFLADLARRGANLEWVPILCGSFQVFLEQGKTPAEDATIEEFVGALRAELVAAGRPARYLAGVDFSHVGPRFGDTWELNEENLRALEASDREVLDAALTGEADRWFEAIAAREDRTHICGFSAVYLLLRTLGGSRGRLLHYEQSPEEDSGSVVTYATIAFEKTEGRG